MLELFKIILSKGISKPIDNISAKLPSIISGINKEGKKVVWACDPMHGNTIKAKTGYKTRPLKNYLQKNCVIRPGKKNK